MEVAIKHMQELKARGIRYSMNGSRTGEDGTGDCSGTIYASLRKAGASDAGWVLNTDSMHSWLEKNGFKLIAQNQNWEAKRGDIVVFGPKGNSGGAAGHIVIFTSQYRIIHCTWKSATANGIYEDDSETTCPYSMGFYVYRLNSTPAPTKPNTSAPKWIKENGNFKLSQAINLREAPNTNSKIIATLPAGSIVKYDYFAHIGNYVWISQPRGKNKWGYLATGDSNNGKRTSYWGTFY